jgi:3-dehydrosphinganine reductase
MARNLGKLKKAQEELAGDMNNTTKTSQIHIISVDVTDAKNVQRVAQKMLQDASIPTPTILMANAGTATAGPCYDVDVDEYHRLMNLNYFGVVHITKAFLTAMRDNGGGSVVITSSMAGQVGVYGYSAYSPTKYALRGFAEALQMEVRRDHIDVILCYPPDTDTPGFKMENETKPKETHLISEAAGLFEPQK